MQNLDQDLVKQTQRGQTWGEEDQARYDAALSKRGSAKERAGNFKPAVEPDDTGKDSPVYAGGTPGFYDEGGPGRSGKPFTSQQSRQKLNVNQDNDFESNVTGDNNYVNNQSDNSVRYYGGNTTNFNYQSSGEGPDTPATMMTLAGIGNPKDSPADTARFIGKYSDMNRDLQKGYDGKAMNVANKYVARAAQTNSIDYQALDQQISQGIQQNYDRATKQQALYQGDVFNYKTPEFKMPKPPAAIESNVGSIAEDYKDDLDED